MKHPVWTPPRLLPWRLISWTPKLPLLRGLPGGGAGAGQVPGQGAQLA